MESQMQLTHATAPVTKPREGDLYKNEREQEKEGRPGASEGSDRETR